MATQLILLDPDRSDFRLDEHTKTIGRRGVAEARRILLEAAARRNPPAAA